MNRINPPKQVVLPVEIQDNLPLKKAFDDSYDIMFQMWKRLGGGDDYIDNLLTDSITKSVSDNKNSDDLTINQTFNNIEDFQFTPNFSKNKKGVLVTGEDATTTGQEIVFCGHPFALARIIYLNATPEQQEKTTIKRMGTGGVTVNGNGKTIDGAATQPLPTIYDSITVIYTIEAGEWSII